VRDIRPDLKERLASAEAKRTTLTAELGSPEGEIRAVMNLIEIEEHRLGNANGHINSKPLLPLEEFIVHRIRAGPSTKDALRIAAQAEGYEINGRNVHGHLLKLIRSGEVKKIGDNYQSPS
jgi:hypothetical protein